MSNIAGLPHTSRKLVAILAANVAGYCTLMQADDEATVRDLKGHQSVILPIIDSHGGRIIDTAGDGILAEFGSVVHAVDCAVTIQKTMAKRNAAVALERRMAFRIGINLGDVIHDDVRAYGNGVNIAARLESIAEPGSICVSGEAYSQVHSIVPARFTDLGELQLKNIGQPVRVYRIDADNLAQAPARSSSTVLVSPAEPRGALSRSAGSSWRSVFRGRYRGQRPRSARERGWGTLRRNWINLSVAAVTALLVLAAVLGSWWTWRSGGEPRVVESSLALPAKPSIAVLPFTNIGGAPEQEYFADGMTDDLITDLSKISGLFVIARNSVFAYKGKATKARDIAEELGVRYLLEGSVRRVGDTVRVNVQLVDAKTGYHLWAERYDAVMEDFFGLQDDIARKVAEVLEVQLTALEQPSTVARRKAPQPTTSS